MQEVQDVATEAPVVAKYLPARQFRQEDAPLAVCVQIVKKTKKHNVICKTWYAPIGQGLHAVDAAIEKVPMGQALQPEPDGENCPAEQVSSRTVIEVLEMADATIISARINT